MAPDEVYFDGPRFGREPIPKEPRALRRLRKKFTYDKQLKAFRQKYDREHESETELEVYCELVLIERYNAGRDDI
jgi:hypothetical protein